jgi:hypothetical protein
LLIGESQRRHGRSLLGLAVEPFEFEPEIARGLQEPHCALTQWPRVALIIAGIMSVSRCSSSASNMCRAHVSRPSPRGG